MLFAAARISSKLNGRPTNSDGCEPSQPKCVSFHQFPNTPQPSELLLPVGTHFEVNFSANVWVPGV